MEVISATTQRTSLVAHFVDRDIMASRGDRGATDTCFPEHWRDVRHWSIEKRQSHRVRLSLTSEPVMSCSFSLCLHTMNILWKSVSHLPVNRSFFVLFSSTVNILSYLDSLLCILGTVPLIVQQINWCSFTCLNLNCAAVFV